MARGTDLTATFSEKMGASTVDATTFKLFKVNPDGTQTQITDVVVSLSSDDGLTATLNPFGVQTPTSLLARSTKYKGVITTGTKDLAGNSLAQQKSWIFTTTNHNRGGAWSDGRAGSHTPRPFSFFLIHRRAWKGDSRKSISRILHRIDHNGLETPLSPGPMDARHHYMC